MKSIWLTLLVSCIFCPSLYAASGIEITTVAQQQMSSWPNLQATLQGSFYGILFTFIIYNLVLFISYRDKVQGYFALALTSLLLHHLMAVDLAFWRQQEHPWITSLLPSALICSSFAWLSFTHHLYEKLITRKIEIFLRVASAALICLIIVLPFTPLTAATLISTYILLATFAWTIYLSYQSWKRRNYSALYILSAMICLYIGSSLNLTVSSSPLLMGYDSVTTIKLLSTLATLLVTISLSVRFHQLQLFKNSLTQITKKILTETGENFHEQLAERTQTLTEQQDTLTQEIDEKNAKLKETLVQLKTSNQLKDDFLNKISHEFKTPLNGIHGSLELTNQTALNEEQQRYVVTALTSSQKLSKLIDDVLDLSQLSAGLIKLNKEPFSLKDALTEAYELFQLPAQDKGLELILEIPDDLPQTVIGDQYRISQVLEKLIANAVKFTSHGKIIISANLLESVGDSAALLFRVKDTGIGIPQDMQEGIFESFRQVERFFSRKYEGTGIGLAVSYHLVKQMGGNISVESLPTAGSTFQFTINLPVIEEKSITLAPKLKIEDRENVLPLKGKILVVDDNNVNQMVMLALLKKLGLYADIADNGKIALQMLTIKHYDLVLMDCQMPVMNGFEATKAIRAKSGKDSRIPIIAVTANTQSSDKTACFEAGMNDFIPKPIKADSLYHKLSEWLIQDDEHSKSGAVHSIVLTESRTNKSIKK